jgi:hypothetical protein
VAQIDRIVTLHIAPAARAGPGHEDTD